MSRNLHPEYAPILLGPDTMDEIVDVLVETFFDYPVMRYVLGQGPEYRARLIRLSTFFARARFLRGEWIYGVAGTEGLLGVATISRPTAPSPPELGAVREETWAGIGEDARARYERFGIATAPFEVDEPHIHLSQIGVRARARGLGLGRLLLEATHELSVDDVESEGVTLTTEVERNVSLYRHFGYEIVGQAAVGSAFRTWGLYRRNDHPEADT